MEMQDMEKDFMSFINSHSFKDKKELYTNGAELVPVFRVQQAYDYYFLKLEKALDKAVGEIQKMIECNNCGSYEICPFDIEHECHHECEDKDKLKEWLMNDD